MAKLSADQLIDGFKELSLIELTDFVKKFEEVFEVTAAAPVAAAAAPAAGGGDAAAVHRCQGSVGRFGPLVRQHATESVLSKRCSTLGLAATS